MNWVFRTGLGVLFCCGSAAIAQDTSCLQRTIPVSVIDRTGAPVPDLTAADYRGEIHRRSVQIVSFSNGKTPHRILILVDTRGSMAGEAGERWNAAVSIAKGLADSKLPDISLALFIFGKKSNERIEFSQGNEVVQARLDQIERDTRYREEHLWGPSFLRDSIVEGFRYFGTPKAGDSIFVITDDFVDNSRTSTRTLREGLESRGMRLFFLIFPVENSEMNPAPFGATPFIGLAEDTGGSFLIWPHGKGDPLGSEGGLRGYTRSAFETALTQLYRQMAESDQLTIQLPSPLERPTDLKLMLSKQKSHQLKGATVMYPHELAPCGHRKP